MASKVVRARCPDCMEWLKIPALAIAKTVRCTNCRTILRPELQARTQAAKAGAVAPPIRAITPAEPTVERQATEPDGPGFFERWEDAETPFTSDYSAKGFPVAPLHRSMPYAAKPSKAKYIVAGVAAILLSTAGIVLYVNRDKLGANTGSGQQAKASSKIVPIVVADGAGKFAGAVPESVAFPRRLLVVSINQYLYANPILFGSPKRSPASLLERLSERWRIPRDQLFLLTDAATNRGAVPPIKPVLEATIASYLATARSQDRITLVYAGHCAVLEGKPYLVPLDGELTVKETLVPLEWLYEKLKACPARQKLLLFDSSRSDPGRGQERPAPGPMPAELEAMLKAPPPGVQVWSSCAAKQHSYEYKYQAFDSYEIEGGLFLNQFFGAFLKGGPGIPKPEDPLPLDDLSAKVNELTSQFSTGIQKEAQTPFLAGTSASEGPAYDANEPAAARVVMPKPGQFVQGGLADAALIKNIFAEIKMPPVKAIAPAEASAVEELDGVVPFAATALKDYQPDYANVRQLLDDPAKFPLRVATLKAVEILDRHGKGDVMVGPTKKSVGLLREELAGPINEDLKKSIEREQREGPAAMHVELEELVATLDKLAPERAKEASKRWQAHYDYVAAMAKSRFAYVQEYNFHLGKIRKDELPPIDEKLHKGWRLAAVEKMSSPRDVKSQADDARKLFAKLIKEHPGTPWEVLAKREQLTALGLAWQPAAIKN